jgi:hypothetical protein
MYFTWVRFRNPGDYDAFNKKLPKSNWADYSMKAVLVMYIKYYVCDSFVLLLLLRDFEMCNFGFFFHHIVTLIGVPFCLTFPHYPWFVIGPVGFHCFLVMFPFQTWLNYGYLFLLMCCMIGLQTKPWYNHTRYRGLLYTGYLLTVGPLLTLWWFECKNDMSNTDIHSI